MKISVNDVEYKRVYQRDALKEAVIAEAYPPSITVTAIHSEVPEHLRCPKLIRLHVSGTTSGGLTFPIWVTEKEGESVKLVYGTCALMHLFNLCVTKHMCKLACRCVYYVSIHAVCFPTHYLSIAVCR